MSRYQCPWVVPQWVNSVLLYVRSEVFHGVSLMYDKCYSGICLMYDKCSSGICLMYESLRTLSGVFVHRVERSSPSVSSVTGRDNKTIFNTLFIPPAQTFFFCCGGVGYIGFTPPVRPASHVCSVAHTVLVRSISYLYILWSNFRRYVACKVSCKISKFEFLAIS